MPSNGRLDGVNGIGNVWRVDGYVENPWIQADIGYQTYVSGVVTQGCGNDVYICWTTKIHVSISSTESAPMVFIDDHVTGLAKVLYFLNLSHVHTKGYYECCLLSLNTLKEDLFRIYPLNKDTHKAYL